MCITFLEFLTRSFPEEPPISDLSKVASIVDSILSQVLLYLSSSHQVYCTGNSSKKRLNALLENQRLARDNSERSNTQYILLCLKVLAKLMSLNGFKTKKPSAELPSNNLTSLADILVSERTAIDKLLECLNMCRGDSLELVEIGLNILASNLSEVDGLDKPTSVEDGVMKTFCLLHKHTNHKEALIRAMLDFFSRGTALQGVDKTTGFCHISELLLWVLLKLLDSDDIFRMFYENGEFVLLFNE